MQLAGARVLVVEDDDAVGRLLEDAISDAGFGVRSASHGAEARRLLDREIPNLRRSSLLNIPLRVLTETAMAAFDLRAFGRLRVMRKPLDLEEWVSTIHEFVSPSAERDS